MNPAERTTSPGKANGPRSTAAWLAARGISAPPNACWQVSLVLDDDPIEPTTELYFAICSEEWCFRLTRTDGVSWIRVLESPQVCERDDFRLLGKVPPLRDISRLVDEIEDRFRVKFRTAHAKIMSTLANSENKIRLWIVATL